MKKGVSTLLFVMAFLIGLSLLLYPTISDYINQFHQSRAIGEYAEQIAYMDDETFDLMWADAVAYNAELTKRDNPYLLSDDQKVTYEALLNTDGSGIMGYIEIPSIDCYLPIYHGTSASVLQRAVGHLEWTSLPVGGESTHSVFSGHRGLPSAKLFTNLSKVVVGDVFMIRVLNETLTYEVDQIITVLPDDTAALTVTEGCDYCTLVTCTPYGINTHRLLVRGHRIENLAESRTVRVTADAIQIEPVIIAPIVAIPLFIVFMMLTVSFDRKRNHK